MKASIWFGILMLSITCCSFAAASDQSPCDAHRTEPQWHIFVDNKDRFCFEYPPEYRVAPAVFAPGVSTGPASEFLGRLATKPGPQAIAIADDESNASIEVFAYRMPFRSHALTRYAPTGLEDIPPKHIHAAREEFFYYGPGGGGVDYPDVFYFGLRDQTFSIEFVGPYVNNKTPDAETKRLEPRVLASFDAFERCRVKAASSATVEYVCILDQ